MKIRNATSPLVPIMEHITIKDGSKAVTILLQRTSISVPLLEPIKLNTTNPPEWVCSRGLFSLSYCVRNEILQVAFNATLYDP